MAQDDVERVLRAQRGGELSIKEVAAATNQNYRTAAKNLQDLNKWRTVTVRNHNGAKKFRINE
jgi:predicted transcriptional regulator